MSKPSNLKVQTLFFLLLIWCAICRAGDYEEARALRGKLQGTVLNERLDPVWAVDGSALFYQLQEANVPAKILRVDTASGKITPAFDSQQLPRLFGQKAQPSDVGIERFTTDKDGNFICLASARGHVKTLLVSGSDVCEVEPSKSPFLLAPQRNHGRQKSRHSSLSSKVFFVNDTDEPAAFGWIDLDGKLQSYGTIPPGAMRCQSTSSGHRFLAGTSVFTATDRPAVAYLAAVPQEERKAPGGTSKSSVEREWRAEFIEHNLWIKNRKTDERVQLTHDGRAELKYCGPLRWSPDGRYLVAWRETAGTNGTVDLIEAAPKGQLQPKRISIFYQKAGDDLFQRKPCLFDTQKMKQIAIDDTLFPNPWSITQLHWTPESDRFFFIYNERGHQTLRVLAVQAVTGKVRAVVEERSDTFINYSNKTYLHRLDATDESIWMSERDGWNHLYLVNRKSGDIKNQITTGDWVVRGVDHVDEVKRQIWFRVGGIRPGQDPYYIHHALINFDGSGLTLLTEGDGTHELQINPSRSFFVDTWSRTDQPPVHELRRSSDGGLVCRLGAADASHQRAIHPHLPEPFVAKGRDGKTDIYGVIYRPTHFDSSKKYPVIETIYAGPHGQFVPKSFSAFHGPQAMAERGFIVVQIDGMGTNWRSKNFHDVCWKNLKDGGFPDRIAWMKAASEKYPFMDLARVGIHGGSAGGQNALRAVLDYPGFYKAAAADCGCHDNRMDKIWWNEAWMGWPVDESYVRSSNVADAHKLEGKLLLTVGALDRNVDPSSTMQVVDALIQADKDFELIVFPSLGHSSGESPYGVRRRQEFFIRHLLIP